MYGENEILKVCHLYKFLLVAQAYANTTNMY